MDLFCSHHRLEIHSINQYIVFLIKFLCFCFRIIYSGGDVNALIQDNTESTKIKLLLQRYETQHFIPSSETG